MLPRELITFATITTLGLATTNAGASVNLQLVFDDNGMLTDDRTKSTATSNNTIVSTGSEVHEVRCFCNQPECVTQGYLCRGRGCFTELPLNLNPSLIRPERSPWHGCLGDDFKDRQCPPEFLCCEQDLCNHVDDPAVRSKLNRTLQDLSGDQRPFLGPIQTSSNHGNLQTTEGWFRTATIAVPICGLVALLVLAGLAVRLLKPMPTQNDKLGPHSGAPDNAPPLLGPPKVPLESFNYITINIPIK
ncbi:BMP and activin membrane-bound inhibitor homolog isoform X3 [Athalia rosae]|uniref:BMP and activin membrane-bound inhibitor homolog isoform X3 n=1 Tax=Athalia rosae TaxID=37344 RepID=UPI00062617B4|nr:BMP and activin membrane-bound inhibitor homolog isoform X3 [Athalia rosae]